MNAYMLLNIPASIVPEQEVITFEGRRYTYSQLVQNSGNLAAALKSRGVGKGDRVGLITTNNPEMVEVFFAAFQIGATIVPINYRAKAEELAYMVEDAGIKVLLFEERYGDVLAPLITKSGIETAICIAGTHKCAKDYHDVVDSVKEAEIDHEEIDTDDVAILLYTSGTTSNPKGVMITHGQITSYVMNHTEVADGTDRGASLVSIPGYHVAGVTSLLNSIFNGKRLVLMRQFNAEEWLETLEKEKANHAFLVPTMLKQAIDHPNFSTTNLESLENLSYGAAPMPLPVIQEAVKLFPTTVNFANAFGMTETTSTVSVLGPEDHKLDGTPEENEKTLNRLASVGKPVPGVEIMILNDENEIIEEPNVTGHVYVRTGRAMKGYWNKDDATKDTLVDGWVNTEDRGWLDEDGYLFLGGRYSDMIIRGGENISPAEIEDVLISHPDISDAAVIGVPSLEWGEEIMAIIVAKNPLTLEDVTSFCSGKLASFKRPSKINFMEELPINSTGKVLKKDLREQFISDADIT